MKLQVATLVKMAESVIVGSVSHHAWMEAIENKPRSTLRKTAVQQFRLLLVTFLMDEMDRNADTEAVNLVRFYHKTHGVEMESNTTIAAAYVSAYNDDKNKQRGSPTPEFVHSMVEATFWLIGKHEMIQAFRNVVEKGVELPNFFFSATNLSWLTGDKIAESEKLQWLRVAGKDSTISTHYNCVFFLSKQRNVRV